MSGALAIDFGTARTLVADASGRILLDEPTLAAVAIGSGELIAFGTRARQMPGRSAGQVRIVRPVAHGHLQDLALTDQIADHLLGSVRRRAGRRPELMMTVPGLATGVQRRALERAFSGAGAGHVEFIEHALATGIGLRLSIDAPVATMVVDVGAGTTDVAVLALGGVVTERSVRTAGEDIDRAIRDLCLRSFDLVVSLETAEAVKKRLATAWPEAEAKIELTGRDVSNGMERTVVLSSSEVAGAIAEPLRAMLAAATQCIVEAPPDLANDLLTQGLHLAGEGALLRGYARRLATTTGIPVHLAAAPALAAVTGAAICLRQLKVAVSGSR
jgi:rod shape-determining protein MreB